jgi:tetratricopeptide (TPR) repeat protein
MTHTTAVSVTETRVTIPTYPVGEPDKNPMFLEKRVYQGSSGVVYPHPIIEKVYDEKIGREYTAVFLENRYLRIMLLPELGGRVQMALDKTNNYHFIYYNRVIKPALVGLTGPWLSGGIEFNYPQHHRPSTFQPVEYTITEHDDGSKTVWCSEIEIMFRTKGMAGFRLYPDRALLEVNVQLYNRTPVPQTFLWWANPAVAASDAYQSIFPPDVHAVMDHGKRDTSDFPIARGTYYKVDYAPGTDISWYRNIPVPTSYMAHHSDFDFIGCYDHSRHAGMMHVANHHLVPGKKQWTWGAGDFGRAWDRQLTDEDGPYVELMCGAFTDNQPDFSWIQPGEEKRFTQIFMPYKGIGGAKNASADAVINLDVRSGTAKLGVYVTRQRQVQITLLHLDQVIFSEDCALTPETAFVRSVPVDADAPTHTFTLRVNDHGHELIRYTPLRPGDTIKPVPARAASSPEAITTNEELFLNGLHLEQYRHATYAPEPYYAEALRRDPLDYRANNAMGLLLLRRGQFAAAEQHFRRAVESLTRRNPNPYDGEPFYNLGLALKWQGRLTQARDAFYKAAWNGAWQDSAYFELARLSVKEGCLEQALGELAYALTRNERHHQARHLATAVMRHLGRRNEARQMADASLTFDVLNFGALFEQALLGSNPAFTRHMSDKTSNYIEIGLDYAAAGLFDEAVAVMQAAPISSAMLLYYRAWCRQQAGDQQGAEADFASARSASRDYGFPNQIECIFALNAASEHDPRDASAPYFLGNFWYAHRCYDLAIACWEQAAALDPAFATVRRNLGFAYMNKRRDPARALHLYQQAFRLDPSDARVFYELDQLQKTTGVGPDARLMLIEQHLALVAERDDLTVEYLGLLNAASRHADALAVMRQRVFHPWEGGEGKVTAQYRITLVEIAKQQLHARNAQEAIHLLEQAQVFPPALGEGKLAAAAENDIFYYLGCACQISGDEAASHQYFEKAAAGLMEPSSPLYYNDQPPEMIFYQGLALRALGRDAEAGALFSRLVAYGEAHLDDDIRMDYFAVSLPDFVVFEPDLNQRNRIHCQFMTGLGCLGLGQADRAGQCFSAVLAADPNHLGAIIHRRLMMDESFIQQGGQ